MAFSVEEEHLPTIAKKYGWDIETTRTKVMRTQEFLGLTHLIDAIEFLLATIVPPKIICDGCNVQPPFEHRCHGGRSVVQGEQTGKMCQCLDCFVINTLGIG